ncbi:MAG: Smr/MutS family protein [Polyangiaceae bacterium]|nr:Smr/MutS family protein [Polyangiaceae bacterium]
MAKRAKTDRTRKPATAQKEAAEAFYRPFSTLAGPPKPKAGGPGPAAPAAAPDASKGKPAPPPAAARSSSAARPAAPEPPRMVDPETFAIYMSGVRALDDRASRIPTTASRIERAPRPAPPKVDPDEGARARLRSLVQEGIRFETSDDGARIEGRRVDVDPRELRRLRAGRYPVDASLDVRAQRADEARAAVEAFVKKRAEAGDRVVSILHREPDAPAGAQGILRGELAAWLSQGHAARHVAAFATAPAAEGSLLVLVAR